MGQADPAGGRIRTLIVDDVGDIRFLYRRALEHEGDFDVIGEAADGHSAVRLAQELQPELLVLDVAMPGMDGVDALPHIRASTPGARIVFVSGLDLTRLVPIFDQTVVGYLEKAMSPRAMVGDLLLLALAIDAADAAVDGIVGPAGEPVRPRIDRRRLAGLVPGGWPRPDLLATVQETVVDLLQRIPTGRPFEVRVQLTSEAVRVEVSQPAGGAPTAGDSPSGAVASGALRWGTRHDDLELAVWADIGRPDVD